MIYNLKDRYAGDVIYLARIAKALGHPARLMILNYLAGLKTCCFGDINNELPISKATVSQHLSELKDAGLITGDIVPPRVNYCLNEQNWDKACLLFESFLKKNKNKIKKCCR